MGEDVIIRFGSDRKSIDADIDAVDKAVTEKKEELVDENKRIAQDVIGNLTDANQDLKIVKVGSARQAQRLADATIRLELLSKEQDELDFLNLLHLECHQHQKYFLDMF